MKTLLTILSLVFVITTYSQENETVHYELLQKALDIKIDGYTPGEPEGASVNASGVSYSMATIKFTNDEGNEIDVSIMDYSSAVQLYAATTMSWAMGVSIDTHEEKASGFELGSDIKGWEVIKKKTGDVTLTMGAKEKYIMTVEMENQESTSRAKEIAKKVKLDLLP